MGQINPFQPIIAPGRIGDRPQSRRNPGGQTGSHEHRQADSDMQDPSPTVEVPESPPVDNGIVHLDMKA